jgi:hypothetical protein
MQVRANIETLSDGVWWFVGMVAGSRKWRLLNARIANNISLRSLYLAHSG